MIVLDASALVELLTLSTRGVKTAQRLRGEPVVHAPYLIEVELLNVIRRQNARSQMTSVQAQRLLADFQTLRLVRHGHQPYLDRIWQLRHNFTAYDACYLALTEALNAVLLTCDTALAQARLTAGRVELV